MTSSLCTGTGFYSLPKVGQQSTRHCSYISNLHWEGMASTCRGHGSQSGWALILHDWWARPSACSIQHTPATQWRQSKCFKVYFANSPSDLWLLASAMFPLLTRDFPLLITDALKSKILTEVYRACLLPCAFSVRCLHHTAKPCNPIHTWCLQPPNCSLALHST